MTTRCLFVLAALLLCALASCSSAASQGGVFIDTTRIPSAMRADYESFAVNCSKCHSLSRALNAPVTNVEHWNLYVAKMMRTAGSAISPQEEPKILRFLHWYTLSYKKTLEDSSESQESAPAYVPPPDLAPPPAPEGAAPPPAAPDTTNLTPTQPAVPAMPSEAGESK
jgi:hypothetical protein